MKFTAELLKEFREAIQNQEAQIVFFEKIYLGGIGKNKKREIDHVIDKICNVRHNVRKCMRTLSLQKIAKDKKIDRLLQRKSQELTRRSWRKQQRAMNKRKNPGR